MVVKVRSLDAVIARGVQQARRIDSCFALTLPLRQIGGLAVGPDGLTGRDFGELEDRVRG